MKIDCFPGFFVCGHSIQEEETRPRVAQTLFQNTPIPPSPLKKLSQLLNQFQESPERGSQDSGLSTGQFTASGLASTPWHSIEEWHDSCSPHKSQDETLSAPHCVNGSCEPEEYEGLYSISEAEEEKRQEERERQAMIIKLTSPVKRRFASLNFSVQTRNTQRTRLTPASWNPESQQSPHTPSSPPHVLSGVVEILSPPNHSSH